MANQEYAGISRNQSQKCFTSISRCFYNLGSARTPAPESLECTYFDLWGAFSPLPAGYPALPLLHFEIEDVEQYRIQLEFEQIEAAKEWSKKLDIPGFIQASSLVSITFSEWVGLDDPFYRKYGLPTDIKEALKRECRKVVDDINKKREEEIGKLKLDQQSYNRHSTMSSSTNPVDKMFNSK